jgi:hypothetical protein
VAGIDTVDQDLDIVAAPDRTWQWKDEDEFAERLALPSTTGCRRGRCVGRGPAVIKLIEAGEFPFDGTWTDFVPTRPGRSRVPLPQAGRRPSASSYTPRAWPVLARAHPASSPPILELWLPYGRFWRVCANHNLAWSRGGTG